MKTKLTTTLLGLFIASVSFGQQVQSIKSELSAYPIAIKKKQKSYATPKALTAIWGAEASNGTADGQFQNAFVNTTTASNYDPNSWSAVSISESNATVFPGNAYWVRSTTGESQGAYWNNRPPVASPTQANGVALFDSDFMDNAGVAGQFGTGTSPGGQHGWLVSPRIDLTGYTDSVVAAKFYAYYRNFNVANFSISISVDDGATWASSIDITNYLLTSANTSNEGWVHANFGNALMGVVNLTQCRIRIQMDTYYYFGMVDDFTLTIAPEQDLSIEVADPNAGTLGGDFYQYQVINNRFVPVTGISSDYSFGFGANVKNRGYVDVLPQDGAELLVNIERDNNGTWTSVLMDTIEITTVTAGGGDVFLDTLSDETWATLGDYRVTYTAQVLGDEVPFNNEAEHFFTITNNYASKVIADSLGKAIGNSRIFPANSSPTAGYTIAEMASGFNFPTAGTDQLVLDSISTQVFVPTSYIGSTDYPVQVRFYEFVDQSGNGYPSQAGDLVLLAVGVDTVHRADTLLGEYVQLTAPLTDINSFTPSYELEDGKIYYASIYLAGNGVPGSEDMVFFGSYDSKIYALNTAATVVTSTYLFTEEFNGGLFENYNWVGFGADNVPVMGLHMSGGCSSLQVDFSSTSNDLLVDFTDISTATSPIASWSWDFGDGATSTQQNPSHTYAASGSYEVCLEVNDGCQTMSFCDSVEVDQSTSGIVENWEDALLIYPNPAATVVQIENLPNDAVTVEIRNVVGQIVYETTVIDTVIEIPVSQLSAGQYNVIIQTASGIAAKHLVVK